MSTKTLVQQAESQRWKCADCGADLATDDPYGEGEDRPMRADPDGPVYCYPCWAPKVEAFR